MTTIDLIRKFVYMSPNSQGRSDALEAVEKLESAFDDQSRELEIAVSFLRPDQLTEFRHRAYPSLYPRP